MRHKQGPRLEVKSSPLQRSSKVGPQLCHKNHGPLFDCITRMCVCVCVCVLVMLRFGFSDFDRFRFDFSIKNSISIPFGFDFLTICTPLLTQLDSCVAVWERQCCGAGHPRSYPPHRCRCHRLEQGRC